MCGASFCPSTTSHLIITAATPHHTTRTSPVPRRPIEEFRSRIRQATAAGEPASDTLAKVTSAYLRFLEECSTFYSLLVGKLQQRYGSVGARLAAQVPGADGAQAQVVEAAPAGHGVDPRLSCHRSLIYLGDLARWGRGLCGACGSCAWCRGLEVSAHWGQEYLHRRFHPLAATNTPLLCHPQVCCPGPEE